MSHFAKVLDGKVVNVIVAEQEFIDSFVDDSPGQWIQTSYNTRRGVHYNPTTNQPSEDQSKALRKNYAGIGFLYDKELDAFIPPKPYPSWILNTEGCYWVPPVQPPSDGKYYGWNEENTSWVEVEPAPDL
jgi:hypothetical protein